MTYCGGLVRHGGRVTTTKVTRTWRPGDCWE